MNKERWTKIALDVEPHIKAIQKITKQAGMDIFNLAAVSDGSWA